MNKLFALFVLVISSLAFSQSGTKKVIGGQPYPNLMINGGLILNQRATTPQNIPTSLGYVYHDRLSYIKSGTCAPTVGDGAIRTGALSPKAANMVWITSASCDYEGFRYKWEATDILPYIGKQLTISFWVNFSATSALHTSAIHLYDAAPSVLDTWTTSTAFMGGTAQGSIASSEFVAGTWKKVSLTWTVPSTVGAYATTNGYGIDVSFDFDGITAVAGMSTRFSEVMVNEGVAAATYNLAGVRVGGEIVLAQRYYEKSFDLDFAPANGPNSTSFATTNGLSCVSVMESNGNMSGGETFVPFAVTKRIPPSLGQYGNSTSQVQYNLVGAAKSWTTYTIIGGQVSTRGMLFHQGASNTLFYNVCIHWTANAEL